MKVVRKGKGIDNGAREAGLGGVKISAWKKEGWKRREKEEDPCRVQMEPFLRDFCGSHEASCQM